MTQSPKYKILVVLSFLFFAFTQQDVKVTKWEAVQKKDGIKVFVRDNSLSPIKEVRAETEIKASLSSLVYLLKHVEKQTEWAYATSVARVHKQYSNFHWVTYTRTHPPWPVDDRDCVGDVIMKQLKDSTIVLKTIGVDSMIKHQKDVVRLPMMKNIWVLTPIDANTTKVRFQILLDLGGNVPSWVVNIFVEDGPFSTLDNFRKEVEKKEYQKIHLKFIKQP